MNIADASQDYAIFFAAAVYALITLILLPAIDTQLPKVHWPFCCCHYADIAAMATIIVADVSFRLILLPLRCALRRH